MNTNTPEDNNNNANVIDVDVVVDESNGSININDTNTNIDNNVNKKTVSKWDVVFYFICGLLADALPGFFFSTTIILAFKVPDGNPTLLSLCSNIGGVLGNIISTFILTKLYTPKFRVILNATIQIIGILLSWLLSYPTNVIVGLSILTIGFQGMLSTIMPLSNYAGGMATRSYQVGFSAAPVLGIILVVIGTSAGFNVSGFFIMALGLPILNTISFFFLDQTVWTDDDKNKDKKDDCKKKNNTTTAGSAADVAIVVIDDNSGGSSDNDNNDKSNAVVDDDDDEIEGQQQLRPSISLFVDDNLRNSTSNSITVSNMSINDYLTATKEIAFKYLPIYFINFGLARFWTDALYQPSFVSSSTTYHGLNIEDAITTSDKVLLSSHIGVFGVGLTIFTCLGTIIPQKLSPYWLWIPNLCQAILLSVVLSGVAYGAFPPLSVGAVYIITTLMWMFMFTVYLYTPLFVRNDTTLTPRYVEFHQQALIITTSLTYLLVDIISKVWWSETVLSKCITSYEEGAYNDYNNNTSCTFSK